MSKNRIRGSIGLGVLLVLYVLVAFLIPFAHTAVFWVSFLFTLVAFGVVAAALYIAFVSHPDAKSRFYGFPIAKIGVIYGIVQLVAGLILMALGVWVPVWAAVLICAIALGAGVIGLIAADAVAEEIQKQDIKTVDRVCFMRNLQSRVNQMAARCDVPEVKKFAEDICFSDPVSSDALAVIEGELVAVVDKLQKAIADGDLDGMRTLCSKGDEILGERNRLCKLNKR